MDAHFYFRLRFQISIFSMSDSAQIGKEVQDRPSPSQNDDDEIPGELEALEEVNHQHLLVPIVESSPSRTDVLTIV